jgi:hypothetical protein
MIQHIAFHAHWHTGVGSVWVRSLGGTGRIRIDYRPLETENLHTAQPSTEKPRHRPRLIQADDTNISG